MADCASPTGKGFGHYRIQGQLGAGGMGVVYSAFDTVLERKVAIKVMGDRTPVDKTARALLIREARAASCLNHPNICTVHEVGDSDGEPYIVMEQVEGEALNSLFGANGLSPDLVVRYGMQIADALAHAHERGVIHRDLKSTNAMVTKDGRVKVLDFGLASRLRDSAVQEAASSNLPLTESRVIVGTLPYLAPELLRGDAADARTDTWSLGILLYEMATGTFPFDGRTGFELSSAILREDPKELPRSVPADLRGVILRCLQKSPRDRYQHASEIRTDLQRLKLGSNPELPEDIVGPQLVQPKSSKSIQTRLGRRAKIMGISAAVLVAAILFFRWFWPTQFPKVSRIEQLTYSGQVQPWGKISTDGTRIFFLRNEVDGWSLRQVPVSGGESQPFPSPFRYTRILDLSPDRSEFLVEPFTSTDWDMEFWMLPVVGGSPRRLSDLHGDDGAFSPDGQKIAYTKVGGIYICSRNGNDARQIVSLPAVSSGLAWSPDGGALRFTQEDPKLVNSSLWEVSADGSNLHVLLPDWKQGSRECCGQWSHDGRYFFFVSYQGEPAAGGLGSVWVLREKGRFPFLSKASAPVRLSAAPVTFSSLRLSADGQRLFAAGAAYEHWELVRPSPDKRLFVPMLKASDVHGASLSPKGDWLAVILPGWTLWRTRPDGTERTQLTTQFQGAVDKPSWSPDGTKIVFQGRKEGQPSNIYVVSAEGGPSQELLPSDRTREAPNWSPDGESVVYCTPRFNKEGPAEDSGIFVLNLKTRKPVRVPESEGMVDPRMFAGGRYLGALSEDLTQVMLFDFQTHEWKEIAHGKSLIHLERSADAKYVYFQAIFEKGEPVYRIHAGDWKVERVMSFESLLETEVARCRFIGVLQDGSPMVLAIRGGYDIYALDLDLP
jgi:eukaryotic-like serine/threonine-protein kinase